MTTVFEYHAPCYETAEDALVEIDGIKSDIEIGIRPLALTNPKGIIHYIDARYVEGVLCFRAFVDIRGKRTYIRTLSDGVVFVDGVPYDRDQ